MWRGKSYTFTRGPFGLKFLSSQFQRLMQAVFKDMPFAYCYIDDIWIVSGDDFALHMSYVKQALDRLTEVRLRVNAEKCEFFLRTFIGLGHRVTPSGIEADPRKVESIMKVPLPESYADLSGFMGLANQLHEHVRHYAELASPLFRLMTTEGRKVDGKPSRMIRPPWTAELIKNFKTLQHAIAHAPALTSPNFEACAQPFSINVDASTFGHGSVIWQPKILGEHMNAFNIISFRSHALKKYEHRYAGSPYKLELLALVTALTDYHDFIWGRSVTVYTDHRALTYIHEQKGLNRHLALWMEIILNYTFDIVHIPGTRNGLADALSRLYPNLWGIPCMGSWEATLKTISLETRTITEEHRQIIQRFHSRGHFGMQSVLRNIKHHDLEWQGMLEDIREMLQHCEVCQRWNLAIRYFHEMRSNQAEQPWTHIQFDLITSFDVTPDGYAYCLVIVCMFTGFSVLLALRTKTALEHIQRLWRLFGVIGLPKIIQSDNEPTFVSALMKGFYDRLRALNITITPYNHRALGKAESSVKTVSNCTHKLLSQCGGTWKELMPSANLSLNIHIAELNGVSAFNLMFNRSPNLDDSDLVRIMPDIGASDQDRMKWIAHQKKVLSEIFPAVTARQVAKHFRQKLTFDASHNVVKDDLSLPAGTMVMLFDELRSSKNEPPYVGPYRITGRNIRGAYDIVDTVGGKFHRDVTIDKMKIIPGSIPQPETSNALDYYVDALLAHKLEPDKQSYLYLVRWAGLDPIEDSWVPAHSIEDSLVRKYMASLTVLPRKRKTDSTRVDSLDVHESSVRSDVTRPNPPVVFASNAAIPRNKRNTDLTRVDTLDVHEFPVRTDVTRPILASVVCASSAATDLKNIDVTRPIVASVVCASSAATDMTNIDVTRPIVASVVCASSAVTDLTNTDVTRPILASVVCASSAATDLTNTDVTRPSVASVVCASRATADLTVDYSGKRVSRPSFKLAALSSK